MRMKCVFLPVDMYRVSLFICIDDRAMTNTFQCLSPPTDTLGVGNRLPGKPITSELNAYNS